MTPTQRRKLRYALNTMTTVSPVFEGAATVTLRKFAHSVRYTVKHGDTYMHFAYDTRQRERDEARDVSEAHRVCVEAVMDYIEAVTQAQIQDAS